MPEKAKLILFKNEEKIKKEEKNSEALEQINQFKDVIAGNKNKNWQFCLIGYTTTGDYTTMVTALTSYQKRVLFGVLEELKFDLNEKFRSEKV